MEKKTTVYNFYGGPGIGKSTTATKFFSLLKSHYKSAELVHEYIKEWAWEQRQILDTDQILILANQHRKERLLYGKVEHIVTDSPMWLVPIYEKELTKKPFVTMSIIDKYLAASPHVEHKHILLKRFFEYDPKGRYHNLKEAERLDGVIKKFLIKNNLEFLEVEVGLGCEEIIARKLGLI